MKRWFIARMVEIEPGEIAPKVATYPNVNFRVWSKDGMAFGLGQLATNNLAQFNGDGDIRIIPDAALDNLLSSIPTATRAAMITALQDGGFNTSAIRTSWSLRQVLQHIKRQLQGDDVIDSGDVRDIEG